MKMILIVEAKTIFPFRTQLQNFLIAGETLLERAQRQLRQSTLGRNFEVLEEQDIKASDFPAMFWKINTVISDALLKEFLDKARSASKSFTVSVSYRDHEVPMSPETAPGKIAHSLSLGFALSLADFNQSPGQIHFESKPPLEVRVRLPEIAYGMRQATVRGHVSFGRKIQSWIDIQQIASMICREYPALQTQKASQYLPRSIVDWTSNSPWFQKRMNRIGKRCKIHPTAILEGAIVGDDVEIGPYAYIQASWIGDGAVIGKHSNITISMVETGAYIASCDSFDSYVGPSSLITPDMLYHCCVGANVFIGGGTGFSDLMADKSTILAQLPEGRLDSGITCLGSAVGEECFIGAGLVFRPGLAIPSGSRILNAQMIEKAPQNPDGVYVAQGNKLLRIPSQFLGKSSK